MNPKSITFRCSGTQMHRMNRAMETRADITRTQFLSAALEEFLNFAEQADTRRMDLFSLVERVDRVGEGKAFSEQA